MSASSRPAAVSPAGVGTGASDGGVVAPKQALPELPPPEQGPAVLLAAVEAQVERALESIVRSHRHSVGRLSAVRSLERETPAAAWLGARLVPFVLRARERLAASPLMESFERRRLDRAADLLVIHVLRVAADAAQRRERQSQPTDPPRRLLERLLRLSPDAIATVRASGRVGLWSVGASRLFGRRRFEVQRRGLARCFADETEFETLLQTLDREGRVDARELNVLHAAGQPVPVRLHGALLQGGGRAPDPDRHLLILHDRTEVQRIRARLIETEKLSAMAKIAGSVAHEFRNPLNSLFLSTDLLEDELEGEEVRATIAPTLAAIREEIERLNQIITHYLALSQIGGDEPEEVDLGVTVAQFVEEWQERAQESKIQLRARADAGPHPIRLDRNQLRRVLLNLVGNAFDALEETPPPADKAAAVTLHIRRMRRSAKLSVKDNGPGIAEELRERVLEPFFTNKAGGSGLGLYLVREIVLASGGTLSFAGGEGRGTTVSIRWPLADAAPAPAR